MLEQKAIHRQRIQNNLVAVRGRQQVISRVIMLSTTAWLLPPRLPASFDQPKPTTQTCAQIGMGTSVNMASLDQIISAEIQPTQW